MSDVISFSHTAKLPRDSHTDNHDDDDDDDDIEVMCGTDLDDFNDLNDSVSGGDKDSSAMIVTAAAAQTQAAVSSLLVFCFTKQAHPSVLLLLLQLCPALVFVSDYSGVLPYYLLQTDTELYRDVLLACVRLSLAVDPDTHELISPARHNFSWHHYLVNSMYKVADLLEEFSSRIPQLAEAVDAHGRPALGVANTANKRLLLARMYFFGRYNIQSGSAEHMSATCKLHFAEWVGSSNDSDNESSSIVSRRVALKFMKNKAQFLSEVSHRQEKQLDGRYVMSMIASHDSDTDPEYRQETIRRGFSEYPYLVVMDAADRNLQSIMKHERLKEKQELLRLTVADVLRCLVYMHGKGLLHADIKRKWPPIFLT